MDFLQLFDADLGVNGGGIQFGVAEKLLNDADVRPIFQHVRGAAMPKNMATAFPFQAAQF